ncbi:DUF6286 domain-containing protein [Frankia sp. CiP3]|uniref:DUF6286 domain-containing protein n=1 Tax=Frankia sp. CiP3 TaxID=2880971 RepID=UPI001EF58D7C|nr:DUF6286 domain-containing protein [Frankia sp. CiP3]
MRVTNRIVAALLAAVIAAVGVIAIIEMVSAALDDGYAIVDWQSITAAMARNTWSDAGPTVLGVILGAGGILLLVLGLRRGRLQWFAVRPSPTGTATFAAGRGIARALASAAEDIDGVTRAKVRLRRRTAKVKIESSPRINPDAPGQVRDEIRERLASFELASPPKVKLKVKASRPASRAGGVVPEPTQPQPAPPPPPPADTRQDPALAGSSGPAPAPATTKAIFDVSTMGERARQHPVGLDLTKPDPEGARRDARNEERKKDHT